MTAGEASGDLPSSQAPLHGITVVAAPTIVDDRRGAIRSMTRGLGLREVA